MPEAHVSVRGLGPDGPKLGIVEGGSVRDLLLHDLAMDMMGEFAKFYGEALAPVLLKALSELAAETAMEFFHLDEHLEALNFAEETDGAG